jgi:UDP-GlcNAc3NAcA epimerase
MIRILTVIGARPQFVKAAVVSRALAATGQIEEILVHTGQHFDPNMSEIFFEEMKIPTPKYNLGIGGGTHGANTGRMIEQIEQLLFGEKPDLVLVFGDTDSTLAAALAAAKLMIPIAHVEAGLRSFNRAMPEEVNRVLTDHLSHFLFSPSSVSVANLYEEGIAGDKIMCTGDVMFDAVEMFAPVAAEKSTILNDLNLARGTYALCTIHRKENTDTLVRLRSIFEALSASGTPIILPLHPRTRNAVKMHDIPIGENVAIIDPVGYLDMLALQQGARVVGTDSGGVQKEAFFMGVPCITFRDETEWVELIEVGANRLVGADGAAIVANLTAVFPPVSKKPIYGSGKASDMIARFIVDRLDGNQIL